MKMKIALMFFLLTVLWPAQQMKEYKLGTPVKIAVPSTYVKSYDLNDFALAQFTNGASEKYVIIIQTEKAHLNALQVAFADINEAASY